LPEKTVILFQEPLLYSTFEGHTVCGFTYLAPPPSTHDTQLIQTHRHRHTGTHNMPSYGGTCGDVMRDSTPLMCAQVRLGKLGRGLWNRCNHIHNIPAAGVGALRSLGGG
jgi:hypothetical protein